jgi:hypothetical protein
LTLASDLLFQNRRLARPFINTELVSSGYEQEESMSQTITKSLGVSIATLTGTVLFLLWVTLATA